MQSLGFSLHLQFVFATPFNWQIRVPSLGDSLIVDQRTVAIIELDVIFDQASVAVF